MANVRQACFATAGYQMGGGTPWTGGFSCHTLELGSFYFLPGQPNQDVACAPGIVVDW